MPNISMERGTSITMDLPTTLPMLEAYFALKLCGVSKRSENEKSRWTNSWTRRNWNNSCSQKFIFVYSGEYSWDKVPAISPELMLLPQQAPIHTNFQVGRDRSLFRSLLFLIINPFKSLPREERLNELRKPAKAITFRKKFATSRKFRCLKPNTF